MNSSTKILVTRIVVAVVAIAAIFGHTLSPAFQGELATAIMATFAVAGTVYGMYHDHQVAKSAQPPVVANTKT